MTTVRIPYSKLHLAQEFTGNLVFAAIVLGGGFYAMDITLWGVLLAVFLTYILFPKGNIIDLWKGEQVALVVREDGFVDYTTSYRLGLIPWEAVQNIELYGFLINKQVRLNLHAPKELLKKEKSFWKRVIMRKNIFFRKTPFCWENKILGISQQNFLQLLQDAHTGSYDFNNLGQHLIEQ